MSEKETPDFNNPDFAKLFEAFKAHGWVTRAATVKNDNADPNTIAMIAIDWTDEGWGKMKQLGALLNELGYLTNINSRVMSALCLSVACYHDLDTKPQLPKGPFRFRRRQE